MIDLHTHTTFSDGVLIPAELARRARVAGYAALAMTDHADHSNIEAIVSGVRRVTELYSPYAGIDLFCGVELTHVPPALIASLVARARELGAQLVVVHGETPVEPVERGTNLAAIEAGADVLAHPGLITPEEAALAAARGVALEITTRKGHSLANGHVAAMARAHGAALVINNDAHEPGDLVSAERRRVVGLGAGLSPEELLRAEANSRAIIQRLIAR
ncbi:histidinol phosphate phosphatase domain-containing protein [Desulfocurvus vexinensis]|uniref:histidinol phosphate phosphatase domain-containing protein n=1 Tax=Desulfocurvus vexinensis TaxID=399548 RepID=UPI00048B5D28|nr:histidinol phosphate phosphatase domain-containing protein [Desulfocurvus vexinensis]